MDFLAVALAGFLGAVTRAYLVKLIGFGGTAHFPFGTLLINLTGCFFLSFFLTVTLTQFEISDRLRIAVGTGFFGAYTTFSAFSLESLNLIRNGLPWAALAYIFFTSVGCVVLAWAGQALGRLSVQLANPKVSRDRTDHD